MLRTMQLNGIANIDGDSFETHTVHEDVAVYVRFLLHVHDFALDHHLSHGQRQRDLYARAYRKRHRRTECQSQRIQIVRQRDMRNLGFIIQEAEAEGNLVIETMVTTLLFRGEAQTEHRAREVDVPTNPGATEPERDIYRADVVINPATVVSERRPNQRCYGCHQ